jgi:hypothetical protein
MGSVFKKAGKLAGKMQPHSWVLGEKASKSLDFGGQLVGAYDDQYKPAEIEAAPTPIVDDQAYVQRDRIRRIAKKAQGRDSTIRTSSTAAPYTGAPAKLLGG